MVKNIIGKNMKKIGIITFHHSYNCGSMMQAFALQHVITNLGHDSEIINFSNEGQKKLYNVCFPNNSLKNIVKNILIFPYKHRIAQNNDCYEEFMKNNMILSSNEYSKCSELNDKLYSAVIAGSDQIWNVTIDDSDDAYFLPWVNNAKKIAYAPSFGAREITKYTNDPSKYIKYLKDFSTISIRENNGKKWIEKMIGETVPVVLDPTLLLEVDQYLPLMVPVLNIPEKYIFYYAPHYDNEIIALVNSIAKKIGLPVVAFNAKGYYVKRMSRYGFILPDYESPAIYLSLIKNAEMIITTSFHGAVFSSIFRKKFWIVKNGGMLENDDRVATMTTMLDLNDRIIPIAFDNLFNYEAEKNYSIYEIQLKKYKEYSLNFLKNALNNL